MGDMPRPSSGAGIVHDDEESEADLILRDIPQERGTRDYWGGMIQTFGGVQYAVRSKPYHWGVNRRTGRLVLLPGPDPRVLTHEGKPFQ